MRQIFVAFSHLAAGVMGKKALALGADFLCPDRMGNFRAKHLDFAAVGFPQQGGDFLSKVSATVHHRQKYDESEYSHCPYCSGELQEDTSPRPFKVCPNCDGVMEWDGCWKCLNCGEEVYSDEDDNDGTIEG